MVDLTPPRAIYRPQLILAAVSLALSLLLIACVAEILAKERKAAIEDDSRELQHLSLALAESTDRGFQGAELIQNDIIDRVKGMGIASSADLTRLMDIRAFHDMLVDKIANVSCIDAITLINARGRLVNFSRAWPIPVVDVSDRDYFKAMADDPKSGVFIGKPVVNRGDGTWTIYLARRISAPDGALIGLVLVAMKVAYFEESFSSFNMPGGRVSLFRQNGEVLARSPHVDAEYAKSYAKLPMFGEAASAPSGGAMLIKSIGDGMGTQRLIGFSRLKHYPAIISVSKSFDAILADWRSFANTLYAATAIMLLLVALAFVTMARSIDHQRRSAAADRARLATEMELSAEREIARQAAHFGIALNNMLHGLSMYDDSDRLIFCNKRYAEMYGLPEELTRERTPWRDTVSYIAKTSVVRDCDIEAASRSIVLDRHVHDTNALRELLDGRSVLVHTRPIPNGGWVALHEDITERRAAEARLSYMARHDTLTGLPNRARFHEQVDEALVMAIREGEGFAVLCLDLDHFKDINDTLGHAIGDELLREVAGRLRRCVRDVDVVARTDGDGFAILRAKEGTRDETAVLAGRIGEVLGRPFKIMGHRINIATSVGIARAPSDDDVGAGLLQKADIALYAAKADGRRQYRFFEPAMDAALRARHGLERDFRKALRRKEFELYFQPLVDTGTMEVTSFEALARWNHPERGLIGPADFIPLAEETGLIIPLGTWVVEAACKAAATWPESVSVAVNVSVSQFKSGDLVEIVDQALRRTGLAARRLELEITESVLLRENETNLATLHALRGLGARIVMDDFGTGYSSLNYLRVFPFDKIKIDRSFAQNLKNASTGAIVQAVLDLGAVLGMRTTIEGVETQAQLRDVVARGCREVQGFLFSRPVPGAEVSAVLAARRATQRADPAEAGFPPPRHALKAVNSYAPKAYGLNTSSDAVEEEQEPKALFHRR
jgi:diguanylate cyclase (GGDEF)-like protein